MGDYILELQRTLEDLVSRRARTRVRAGNSLRYTTPSFQVTALWGQDQSAGIWGEDGLQSDLSDTHTSNKQPPSPSPSLTALSTSRSLLSDSSQNPLIPLSPYSDPLFSKQKLKYLKTFFFHLN